MKNFDIHKVAMTIFLIGILTTTFFNQNVNLRRKANVFPSIVKISNPSSDNASDTSKKNIPTSTNLITEEEDKIIEEIESICTIPHPIIISISFSFPHPIFEEPFLKVTSLPPWA